MPTIQDVAREAEVSPATVSRVLNGSFAVSADKREKVLEVAKRVGYQLPTKPSQERDSKDRLILVLSGIEKSPLFHAIQESAYKQGYGVLFGLIGEYYDGMEYAKRILQGPCAKQIVGVILLNVVYMDEELGALLATYPLVQLEKQQELPGSNVIATDNCSACYELVSRLIAQGRRRIAFVSMALSDTALEALNLRRRGYMSALAEYGLEIAPGRMIHTDFSMEGGESAARQLLALEPRPDAVCCVSDTVALGVMSELHRQGVAIPGDIAVTGFDNDEYAAYLTPPLTTVDLNLEQIGREAVAMLDKMQAGDELPGHTLLVPYQLQFRESSEMKQD